MSLVSIFVVTSLLYKRRDELAQYGAHKRDGWAMIAPVHVFAFADSAHPSLCTLASSVAFAGGRLNVVGLNSAESSGEVPPEALEVIAEALAEQGQDLCIMLSVERAASW
eukprot:g19317.t1